MKTSLFILIAVASFASAQSDQQRGNVGGRRPMPDRSCPVDHSKVLETQINDLVNKVIKLSGTTSQRKKNQLDKIVSDLEGCKRLLPAYYAECVVKTSNEAVTLALKPELRRPEPVVQNPNLKTCLVQTTGGIPYAYLYNSSYVVPGSLRLVNNGAVLALVSNSNIYYEGAASEGVQLRVISNPSGTVSDPAQSGETLWYYKNLMSTLGCSF